MLKVTILKCFFLSLCFIPHSFGNDKINVSEVIEFTKELLATKELFIKGMTYVGKGLDNKTKNVIAEFSVQLPNDRSLSVVVPIVLNEEKLSEVRIGFLIARKIINNMLSPELKINAYDILRRLRTTSIEKLAMIENYSENVEKGFRKPGSYLKGEAKFLATKLTEILMEIKEVRVSKAGQTFLIMFEKNSVEDFNRERVLEIKEILREAMLYLNDHFTRVELNERVGKMLLLTEALNLARQLDGLITKDVSFESEYIKGQKRCLRLIIANISASLEVVDLNDITKQNSLSQKFLFEIAQTLGRPVIDNIKDKSNLRVQHIFNLPSEVLAVLQKVLMDTYEERIELALKSGKEESIQKLHFQLNELHISFLLANGRLNMELAKIESEMKDKGIDLAKEKEVLESVRRTLMKSQVTHAELLERLRSRKK